MAEKYYLKQFDGNYSFANWEFRINLILEEQGVLYVLTENPPAETETSKLLKWKKDDIKARNTIIQCLSDNILESIKNKNSAKEIMESLGNTWSKKGISTQVMLQKKLRSLQYTEGAPLNNFFQEFDNTVSQLKTAGGNIDNNELILQLLSSMPESYQSVTTAIDIMFCQNQNAVDLDFVKNKLLLDETRQRKIKHTQTYEKK